MYDLQIVESGGEGGALQSVFPMERFQGWGLLHKSDLQDLVSQVEVDSTGVQEKSKEQINVKKADLWYQASISVGKKR